MEMSCEASTLFFIEAYIDVYLFRQGRKIHTFTSIVILQRNGRYEGTGEW